MIGPVAPPPPTFLPPVAAPRSAYSSELTPRSYTACPFPHLAALPSRCLGTERAPADSATRTARAVRRQVSEADARLDPPTDYRNVGLANASIAGDAIRLRKVRSQ